MNENGEQMGKIVPSRAYRSREDAVHLCYVHP